MKKDIGKKVAGRVGELEAENKECNDDLDLAYRRSEGRDKDRKSSDTNNLVIGGLLGVVLGIFLNR